MNNQNVGINPNIRYPQQNSAQNNNPAMQGNEGTDVITQAGGGTYVNRIKASQDADPATKLGLTAVIGYGIGQAMDKFDPKCEGQYEKTILGKLGNAGDKFAQKTKVGRFIEKNLQRFDDFMTRWAAKSKIGYSLKNHSTAPEWSFAKMPFQGLPGYWSMDAKNIIEEHLKPISGQQTKFLGFPIFKWNHFNRLAEYGLNKEQIVAFENSLKGKSFAEKALALQIKELELMGFDPVQYAGQSLKKMQAMARSFKIKNRYNCSSRKQLFQKLDNIVEKSDTFMKMLKDATLKDKGKIVINKFDNSLLGRVFGHLFGRETSLEAFYNKGLAALKQGNKTKIGKFLPNAFGWLVEGSTNRFAGGKLAPFIQAAIFADMAYHTYNAPKGEKIKTFVERFVNDFTYFVAGTLGVIGLHKFGGFKYLGTNNAGKLAYRDALKEHNNLRKMGFFSSHKEAKAALKQVESLLGTKNLNFFEKILQKAALLINCGNEHATWYRSKSKFNLNGLRKIMNSNLVGVPLRIWLVMFTITPLIVKATTKAAHLIFGKPTYSVLDEDNESEEEQPNSQVQPSQQVQNNPQTNQNGVNVNNLPESNLVKQTVNGQYPPQYGANTYNNGYRQNVPQYKYNPQTKRFDEVLPGSSDYVNNQMTPSAQYSNVQTLNSTQTQQNLNQNNQNNTNNLEPVRTYIPSATPVQSVAIDTSAADSALARADKAEKEVQSILARRR